MLNPEKQHPKAGRLQYKYIHIKSHYCNFSFSLQGFEHLETLTEHIAAECKKLHILCLRCAEPHI